ncbi:hypothetical protein HK102_003836 [Quaeritorhiza haematococci]|nr:hypothetical protein HK102_003836 [Quaeritorhiza haematococci]
MSYPGQQPPHGQPQQYAAPYQPPQHAGSFHAPQQSGSFYAPPQQPPQQSGSFYTPPPAPAPTGSFYTPPPAGSQQSFYTPAPLPVAGGYGAYPDPAAATRTAVPTGIDLHGPYVGPFLRYGNYDPAHNMWSGSVLILSKNPHGHTVTVQSTAPEVVSYNTTLKPVHLDTFADVIFWRFDISVPARRDAVTLRYNYFIDNDTTKMFSFHVAGAQEVYWRWASWSCNGWSAGVKPEERQRLGDETLWKDVMYVHAQTPIHVQVGGGDQVYADAVWKECPGLISWLAIKGKENRQHAPWTPDLDWQVSQFYMQLYVNHFRTNTMKDALANIPYTAQADDHDIFDGYGSYPEYLTHSNVMKNIGRIAIRFFLLFQLHTTPAHALADDLFGGPIPQQGVPPPQPTSFSFIKLLGSTTALLGIDTRSERTANQVITEPTWDHIFWRLSLLPASVRHLVVLTGVPVVYPRLTMAEIGMDVIGSVKVAANGVANVTGKLLGGITKSITRDTEGTHDGGMGALKKAFGKSGLMSSVLNQFGEPELADDLCDHWTHDNHAQERTIFVQRLQTFAQHRHARVTFISGDVHVGGAGFFYSTTPAPTPEQDFRLMYQIISSAIINVAPSKTVLGGVLRGARPYKLDQNTTEDMIPLFTQDVDGTALTGNSQKLLGRRNWCISYPGSPSPAGPHVPPNVVYELRMEGDQKPGLPTPAEMRPYHVVVPSLA